MSLNPRYFAPLLVAAWTAAIAVVPIAAADPVGPVPGNQSPADTLSELQAQGYALQINWVTGYPTVRCTSAGSTRSTIPTTHPTLERSISSTST
jgi:hypothetical protein